MSGKVEVDETVVGGQRHGLTRGWRADDSKGFVMVAAEVRGEAIGRIRLGRVPAIGQAHFCRFVESSVAPGSEIITDGTPGYGVISEKGYRHSPNILSGHGRAAPKFFLPRVHQVASLLKRWLLGIHQGRVSRAHLDYYLDEFVFRFNRRASAHRGMLFYRLIQQAVVIEPTRYKDLIGKARRTS